MRMKPHAVLRTTAVAIFLTMTALLGAPTICSAAPTPTAAVCDNKANPPTDAVTQGGCFVLDRKKGNCMGCHAIVGMVSGNVAPPLVSIQARFPDKKKLREQIFDATKVNPKTVMPPFGRHNILTQDEIDKIVEFVSTL